MKKYSDIFKQLALLTQFGLSLLMPTLLCVLGCAFLVSKTGLGEWIFIPGFFFGLGGSAVTAMKFYRMALKDTDRHKKKFEDDKRKNKVFFNDHS